MINIGKILKRAWHIVWNYRVLWIFGILLAITAGGGGGGNSGSSYQFGGNRGNNPPSGPNPNFHPGPVLREFIDWFNQNLLPLFEHPEQYIATFIWIGVAFLLLILVLSVIGSLVRYPSETAVIRMVDEYEQSGSKVGFKQGWKLGWNRRAFRIWLIDLLIGLPIFLVVALMVALGMLVFISIGNGNQGTAVAGTIAAIGCAFLFIFIFIAFMVFISLLRQFFVRAAALEETSLKDAFRNGWATFKRNWKSAALMWLVMLGIGIGYGIAGVILFILLIPVYLVLILPAALVAVIPGAIALGITSIFTSSFLIWIVGILVALPFFFTVLFAPLTLVGGLYMIFESSVWTLTYREMKTLEKILPVEAPKTPANKTGKGINSLPENNDGGCPKIGQPQCYFYLQRSAILFSMI